MRFERTVHLVREGQVVDADDATVHLLPERDEPKSIELRGHSRVEGGTGVGSLRLMSARDITLDLCRRWPDAAAGDSGRARPRFSWPAKDGSRGQQLSAEFLRRLARARWRDHQAVAVATTSKSCCRRLERCPPRTIRSTSLTATGAAGQGLTTMKFQEGTDFEEAATPEHAARTARAQTLDAELNPGTDALRQAKFTGAFRFEEGPMKATSAEALYAIEAGPARAHRPRRRQSAARRRRQASRSTPIGSTSHSRRARWSQPAACAR